ncbi:MAG TPA: hypothetical protein DEG17_23840 [Cyanobacteria bacterium UBA11149]|nr:hypothetical protein [Cyanobacteria bacterium UBA11367]HBE59148.1 hypothetical protein [Cyanobacteria bacterium UBA11366]HBK66808.1 hypothetical protein [Cyanobacteria bacterium UBA11166]HBR74198.1 hypothetical protein [Cyanobacteria bacterium UBA11159]HBS70438.1 hypothetical protein [Cyanobacteria bacterium UBA11153]HBW91814.1 hypothetical protein [Cyanobacteria bacterium UBA11149]HCA94159.1 hypothetical protein [Cyanobacteria bacterium UBA9226]
MNFNKISIFAGLVATSTLALSAIPANAYTLNPGGTFTVKAGEKLDFTFIESHGMFRSDFGIYNAASMTLVSNIFSEKTPGYDPGSNDAKNDWLGTCPTTVASCNAWYTFAEAGTYKFGLTAPGGPTKTKFTEHTGEYDDASTAPMPGIISTADEYTFNTIGPTALANGKSDKLKTIDTSKYGFFVAINDSNKVDGDIQDMIVGVKKTPEPATLGGLALVGGAIAMIRRRKENKA